REVGLGRLLPQPQPREDVRGHMDRVRRGGRDLRGGPRGRQRQGSQGGVVEGVDEVVGDAGVLRFFLKQRVQDPGGLLLVREGCVRRRGGGEKRERVEDRGLVVVRPAPRELLH